MMVLTQKTLQNLPHLNVKALGYYLFLLSILEIAFNVSQ